IIINSSNQLLLNYLDYPNNAILHQLHKSGYKSSKSGKKSPHFIKKNRAYKFQTIIRLLFFFFLSLPQYQ
ncbi:hypothetical protein, partial [Bacteroides xylanisolvens]|uniref:hypothetical protein n=2 Tax=Bacteroides xylanisolvens TaxID=371601 RepID=UPI0019621CA6